MTIGARMPEPKRRRAPYATPTRQVHREFQAGQRQQMREAREYAEAWYQVLRAWTPQPATVHYPALTYSTGLVRTSTLGEGGPDRPSYLVCPSGEYHESEIAHQISMWHISTIPSQREHGVLLEKIRRGTALASLIHHSGRGWADPSSTAQAYAQAVLTLAVSLSDPQAETHLLQFARLSRTVQVELQK